MFSDLSFWEWVGILVIALSVLGYIRERRLERIRMRALEEAVKSSGPGYTNTRPLVNRAIFLEQYIRTGKFKPIEETSENHRPPNTTFPS